MLFVRYRKRFHGWLEGGNIFEKAASWQILGVSSGAGYLTPIYVVGEHERVTCYSWLTDGEVSILSFHYVIRFLPFLLAFSFLISYYLITLLV